MKYTNSQKGIAPIIAVILLAVILIGGGAYYFKQQAKQASKSNVVDETANWKTYTNTEAKVSFQYPIGWVVKEENLGEHIRISIEGKEGNILLDYGSGFGGACQSAYEDFSIGNAQTQACHEIYKDAEKWSLSNMKKDNINFNNINYSGFVNVNAPYKDNRDVILKILSTFKFTDQNQTVDTSTWKTYTNSDYKFSLKYPQKFTLKAKYYSNKGDAYSERVGNFGQYQLWFYATEEGVEKYSGYSIDLYTSSNKTLAEQFPNESLELLSDNHGADEAAGDSFKSNEPGSRNENFTQQYFRVKNTVFVVLPILQDASATDEIWNYPVLETLRFTK